MKRLFTIGENILFITFSIYIIYTIVFLLKDGWHIEPINPIEKTLDKATSFLMTIGFILIAIPSFKALRILVLKTNIFEKSSNEIDFKNN